VLSQTRGPAARCEGAHDARWIVAGALMLTCLVTLSHKLLDVPVGATVAVREAMRRTPSRTQAFDPVSWGVYKATQ
jgi:hypothetical protein